MSAQMAAGGKDTTAAAILPAAGATAQAWATARIPTLATATTVRAAMRRQEWRCTLRVREGIGRAGLGRRVAWSGMVVEERAPSDGLVSCARLSRRVLVRGGSSCRVHGAHEHETCWRHHARGSSCCSQNSSAIRKVPSEPQAWLGAMHVYSGPGIKIVFHVYISTYIFIFFIPGPLCGCRYTHAYGYSLCPPPLRLFVHRARRRVSRGLRDKARPAVRGSSVHHVALPEPCITNDPRNGHLVPRVPSWRF